MGALSFRCYASGAARNSAGADDPSTSGGSPAQKAHTDVHAEVPTGILLQPFGALTEPTTKALCQPPPPHGVVKQDKSSGGSVDTTKTRSDPQRVGMCKGERPMGAGKGKQTKTMASFQPSPPRTGR